MNFLDEYTDYYDTREYNQPCKKKATRRRWRDIERIKEESRMTMEIIGDDLAYFDMLDRPMTTSSQSHY